MAQHDDCAGSVVGGSGDGLTRRFWVARAAAGVRGWLERVVLIRPQSLKARALCTHFGS
jgi:hypothetical protein